MCHLQLFNVICIYHCLQLNEGGLFDVSESLTQTSKSSNNGFVTFHILMSQLVQIFTEYI